MDIVALESFVTVYNYKNFTKAADKLYISQPALSRRMKVLKGSPREENSFTKKL